MEEKELIEAARKFYLEEGYSCSESVLRALRSAGIEIPEAILRSVAGLRAGIGGSGCVCGALMAAVLLVGNFYGGTSNQEDTGKAHEFSANLHNQFKDKFKSTCCRVLTRKFDFKSQERKEFCAGLVADMVSELARILPASKN
jgi:C_GCAxxG_C_C family probable redox protein